MAARYLFLRGSVPRFWRRTQGGDSYYTLGRNSSMKVGACIVVRARRKDEIDTEQSTSAPCFYMFISERLTLHHRACMLLLGACGPFLPFPRARTNGEDVSRSNFQNDPCQHRGGHWDDSFCPSLSPCGCVQTVDTQVCPFASRATFQSLTSQLPSRNNSPETYHEARSQDLPDKNSSAHR